ETREGLHEALEELRELAHGIHPPVLTDRGLEAAVSTLADGSPVPVRVEVDLAERPPAVVETAAYFVVAEALANAIKHALATHVNIRSGMDGSRLLVEIDDDGRRGSRSVRQRPHRAQAPCRGTRRNARDHERAAGRRRAERGCYARRDRRGSRPVGRRSD